MNDTKVKVYAQVVRSKDPTSTACWYRLFFDQPTEAAAKLRGPYRDGTDAENAAHEEARRRNLEIEWTEWAN